MHKWTSTSDKHPAQKAKSFTPSLAHKKNTSSRNSNRMLKYIAILLVCTMAMATGPPLIQGKPTPTKGMEERTYTGEERIGAVISYIPTIPPSNLDSTSRVGPHESKPRPRYTRNMISKNKPNH